MQRRLLRLSRFRIVSIIPIFCIGSFLLADKCSAASSASLSLSNDNMISDAVAPGTTATTSTNVTVNVSDVESYSLILSFASTTLANGTTTINAGTVTSDNTWGYKWDNAASYSTPTTTGSTLTVPALSDNAANFTKTLTFGAKFANNAIAGHYTNTGTLSLAAAPKAVTYTLTYNLNGGNINNNTTSPTQSCTTYDISCIITVSYASPTRTGYNFLGWGDSSTGSANSSYGNGNNITLSGDKVVYGVWEAAVITYSVTYIKDTKNVGAVFIGTAPEKQEAQSTANSYTFIAADRGTLYPNCSQQTFWGWATTSQPAGSTTVTYTAGSTIALTRDNPEITLYSVFTYGGTCAY